MVGVDETLGARGFRRGLRRGRTAERGRRRYADVHGCLRGGRARGRRGSIVSSEPCPASSVAQGPVRGARFPGRFPRTRSSSVSSARRTPRTRVTPRVTSRASIPRKRHCAPARKKSATTTTRHNTPLTRSRIKNQKTKTTPPRPAAIRRVGLHHGDSRGFRDGPPFEHGGVRGGAGRRGHRGRRHGQQIGRARRVRHARAVDTLEDALAEVEARGARAREAKEQSTRRNDAKDESESADDAADVADGAGDWSTGADADEAASELKLALAVARRRAAEARDASVALGEAARDVAKAREAMKASSGSGLGLEYRAAGSAASASSKETDTQRRRRLRGALGAAGDRLLAASAASRAAAAAASASLRKVAFFDDDDAVGSAAFGYPAARAAGGAAVKSSAVKTSGVNNASRARSRDASVSVSRDDSVTDDVFLFVRRAFAKIAPHRFVRGARAERRRVARRRVERRAGVQEERGQERHGFGKGKGVGIGARRRRCSGVGARRGAVAGAVLARGPEARARGVRAMRRGSTTCPPRTRASRSSASGWWRARWTRRIRKKARRRLSRRRTETGRSAKDVAGVPATGTERHSRDEAFRDAETTGAIVFGRPTVGCHARDRAQASVPDAQSPRLSP